MQYFFFVHAGVRIGTLKGNTFTPTQHIYWHIEDTSRLPVITLKREEWSLLCEKKPLHRIEEDGYYGIQYGRGMVGVGLIRKGEVLMHI